ncbi:MAG TPA: transglycosylase domain-containing protein, partial [Stellaceae bacterium]|nr:transglycosylase domain-containing protein [Stellaceae bacterium]
MDKGSPPRRPSVPSADPAPPSAEPELGTAVRLLAAALTILLRRAVRRTEALLRPIAARGGGAIVRLSARVRRLWARRSAPAAAAISARSPQPMPPTPPAASPVPRPRRRRLLRLIRVLSWTGGAAVLALAAFLGYCLYTLPLAQEKPAATTPSALVFTADNGRPFATRGIYKGQWVPATQLPGDFIHAVVAIEDRRFFQHPGVDFWGIARAAVDDLLTGSVQQGGSTITQQLVRMTYLSPKRTILRKVQEALLAIWLEHRLSKTEILARYVNTAYYGAGAYGVDAAAERYFDKHAQALDLAEAAMLAGLVNAPSELAPTINLAGARERADAVLNAMLQQGYISPAQAKAARAHPATPVVP